VPTIELDDRTAELVRFAARLFGVSESEVVARAVREFAASRDETVKPPNPFAPIAIYGEYEGRRFDAEFLPATGRVTVLTEPLEGQRFRSPSGAARAVVALLNPGRSATQTNGWRFWRLAESDARLEVVR
jgi:hypothetical protein